MDKLNALNMQLDRNIATGRPDPSPAALIAIVSAGLTLLALAIYGVTILAIALV